MGSSLALTDPQTQRLVLFDGVCNLCNGAVQFVIKRDRKQKFTFASLQSAVAKHYINQFQVTGPDLDSILLIKNGKIYDRSAAVLEIARELSGLWPLLYAFKIIPRVLRDTLYGWIAKNRYRLFGKKDHCLIPTPELKARFIDL